MRIGRKIGSEQELLLVNSQRIFVILRTAKAFARWLLRIQQESRKRSSGSLFPVGGILADVIVWSYPGFRLLEDMA